MSDIRYCHICKNTRKSSKENKVRCTRFSREVDYFDTCDEFVVIPMDMIHRLNQEYKGGIEQ